MTSVRRLLLAAALAATGPCRAGDGIAPAEPGTGMPEADSLLVRAVEAGYADAAAIGRLLAQLGYRLGSPLHPDPIELRPTASDEDSETPIRLGLAAPQNPAAH